jgi:hypothetical protein
VRGYDCRKEFISFVNWGIYLRRKSLHRLIPVALRDIVRVRVSSPGIIPADRERRICRLNRQKIHYHFIPLMGFEFPVLSQKCLNIILIALFISRLNGDVSTCCLAIS